MINVGAETMAQLGKFRSPDLPHREIKGNMIIIRSTLPSNTVAKRPCLKEGGETKSNLRVVL